MSERKPELLLQDILESASKILEYTKNLSFDQFVSDSKQLMPLSGILKSLVKLQDDYLRSIKIFTLK